MKPINRRIFLVGATAATAALASRRSARADSPNEKVSLAIMGAHNRGSQLAEEFLKLPLAHVAYICDCDQQWVQKGLDAAVAAGGSKPKGINDFRRALDDSSVDALVVAAPNHWHAPATLLACAAGKHVYVEKPVSYTPDEGEKMIAAARAANRVVQPGLQRRSSPLYQKAVKRVNDGALGRVLYARSTYNAHRPTLGKGKETAPPASLDYNLWQGAATEMPYRDNVIPYNWHFFWHWGNGELGNNGVHTIDICRWALGVDYPTRVTAAGSKLRFPDDDQETPDTCTATFECGDKTIVWEGLSWSPAYANKVGIGIELRGEEGTLYVDDDGYTIYDLKRKVVEEDKLGRGDEEHLSGFLEAVRNNSRPAFEIEEGHKSTMFCHLGNIAYRLGQSLDVDPQNGHIKSNPAAGKYWAREYRKGWMPG
jgi:predicted dehydrogenase